MLANIRYLFLKSLLADNVPIISCMPKWKCTSRWPSCPQQQKKRPQEKQQTLNVTKRVKDIKKKVQMSCLRCEDCLNQSSPLCTSVSSCTVNNQEHAQSVQDRVVYMHSIVWFIIVFNTVHFQHQNIWSRVWELPGPVRLTRK